MTDIIATLKPAQGIQCEQSLLYLFDPNVVNSIAETTTRQWLEENAQQYITEYIQPIMDNYEQEKERQIDAYVEEKQSTIFFDNTNLTGITTAETLNITNKINVSTINNGGDIAVPTSAGTMALTSDLTNFADKDLSNLTSQGKNIANWSSNISNCITEIPQDIKVEASTLKAGSKAYIPNGAGVFDTVILPSDITISASGSYTRMLFLTSSGSIDFITLDRLYSGATAPTGFTGTAYWYDTTNNVIKTTTDSGNTWNIPNPKKSLPIALFTTTNGTITSIEVFNGFGYIGIHNFRLPGLKGLAPNGKNTNGTLKNTKWELNTVLVTQGATATGNFLLIGGNTGLRNQNTITYFEQPNKPTVTSQYNTWYDTENNYIYYTNDTGTTWVKQDVTVLGVEKVTSGKIDSLNVKDVFHAVDSNDTEFIGHQAMLSDKYIDLTLPASDSTFTAQADGKYYFQGTLTSAGYKIRFENLTSKFQRQTRATQSSQSSVEDIECSKGDTIKINYDGTPTDSVFRFIYTNGSK